MTTTVSAPGPIQSTTNIPVQQTGETSSRQNGISNGHGSDGGWITPVAKFAPSPTFPHPFMLDAIVNKFIDGGVHALTPNEFSSLVTFVERVSLYPEYWPPELQGTLTMPDFGSVKERDKAELMRTVIHMVTMELKAAESRGELADYLAQHELTPDKGAKDWQHVIRELPKMPVLFLGPDILKNIVASDIADHRLAGCVVPFIPAEALALDEVVTKFLQGGVEALAPNEFSSLVAFVDKTLKHSDSVLIDGKRQPQMAQFMYGVAYALALDLKAAVKSGEVSEYLFQRGLTYGAAQNWEKAIETILAPEIKPYAESLRKAVAADVAAQKLDGVALPFVSWARPASISTLMECGTIVTDGTSPSKAIPVSGSQLLEAVSRSDILKVIGADAIVLAASGQVGLQNIPGWDKIPGLKDLAKDTNVKFLIATLTPFNLVKDGEFAPSAQPLKSTMFISLTLPGKTPFVMTTKLADMNFEVGRPIKNQALLGGQIILFSNFRAGITEGELNTLSVNGGVLLRAPNVKKIVTQIKTVVTRVARTAEAAEMAAGLAAAPETGGSSIAAAAATTAATETARYAILRSLTDASFYVGFAWRASANLESHDGGVSATIEAQKGPLKGKWIEFNLADVPASLFEDIVPDLEAE